MMFNKDQAAKLRDLAQNQGLAHKEEPLTYSAIIGEDRQSASSGSSRIATKGIIIAGAGMVALGVVLGIFFILQQNESKYRQIISTMNRSTESLKAQLEGVTEKTRQLEGALALNMSKNQELVNQVNNLNGTNASLNAQLEALAQERTQLMGQIADTRARAVELEKARRTLQDEMRTHQEQMQEKIAALNARIAQKAVEVPAQAPSGPVLQKGQIVFINRQEGFVLINKGRQDGIKNGMQLTVSRQGAMVANLQVNEARDQVSACDIVWLAGTIQLGDEVSTR